MLSTLFNKLGERSMYVATSVQEAAVATCITYAPLALNLVS